MTWRPEGWDAGKIVKELAEKKKQIGINIFYYAEAVEAGADAMLEALRDMGTPTGLKYTAYAKDRKGYLVLIPDEKTN